ncbi:hypothetical protein JOC26_001306 [Sporohalobacter salinus]|nr:hypothetical protein [Sporohalobacter salinus]
MKEKLLNNKITFEISKKENAELEKEADKLAY